MQAERTLGESNHQQVKEGTLTHTAPLSWASGLQNYERINLWCPVPPNLWCFVMAGLTNRNICELTSRFHHKVVYSNSKLYALCKLKSYNRLASLFVWVLYPPSLYLYCIPFAVIHNRFSFDILGQNAYNSVLKIANIVHFRKSVSDVQYLDLKFYCWFRIFSPRPHVFLRHFLNAQHTSEASSVFMGFQHFDFRKLVK